MIRVARQEGLASSHTLRRGLKMSFAPCLRYAGTRVYDLASRYDFSLVGTAYSVGVSPWGPAFNFTGNASFAQTVDAGLPAKVLTGTDAGQLTIQALFKFNHSAAAKESTIFWSDNPTVGSSEYGYRLFVDNNTDKVKLQFRDNWNGVTGINFTYTSATTLTAGRWYHLIAIFSPALISDVNYGQGSVFWLDGQFEFPAISGTENYVNHLATQDTRVGSSLGSTAPDHSVALVNVWNRALTFPEIDRLSADPLRMFRMRRDGGGHFRSITPWYLAQRRRAS